MHFQGHIPNTLEWGPIGKKEVGEGFTTKFKQPNIKNPGEDKIGEWHLCLSWRCGGAGKWVRTGLSKIII